MWPVSGVRRSPWSRLRVRRSCRICSFCGFIPGHRGAGFSPARYQRLVRHRARRALAERADHTPPDRGAGACSCGRSATAARLISVAQHVEGKERHAGDGQHVRRLGNDRPRSNIATNGCMPIVMCARKSTQQVKAMRPRIITDTPAWRLGHVAPLAED